MPKFSERSLERLETCHPDLQAVMNVAILGYDFTILEGHRGRDAQNEAHRTGKSQLKFPQSKHNKVPALAVDIAPYPVDWEDLERFYFLAGYVHAVADRLEVEIRWGGDWDGDGDLHDSSFLDLPHFELVT